MSNNRIFRNIKDPCSKKEAEKALKAFEDWTRENPQDAEKVCQAISLANLKGDKNKTQYMEDLCRLYATLQSFAWKKKIADPIPKTYSGWAMSKLRKLYTALKSIVWKKETAETEWIPVPCIALLMKQILRIAQERIIANATKTNPSNDPEERKLLQEEEKFLNLARGCAWYSTKFDTMCSLTTNHSLAVLTLGTVPVVASFIAAGLQRKTYEKRRDTTEKFIQIFTGCKPSELNGRASSGTPTCKDTSYFIHSANSELRAMMRDEPEFVPNEKFFYRFKSDWGYYLWKGLGAIPGLSFLKPKKVQHEESLTYAQSMLCKIDEKAKEIDEKRKEREKEAKKKSTRTTVPSFPYTSGDLERMAHAVTQDHNNDPSNTNIPQ